MSSGGRSLSVETNGGLLRLGPRRRTVDVRSEAAEARWADERFHPRWEQDASLIPDTYSIIRLRSVRFQGREHVNLSLDRKLSYLRWSLIFSTVAE